MTDPDDNLRDGMEGLLSEADERNKRIELFTLRAKAISGPLGVLLRTVSAMHENWAERELAGCVTVAEETSMWQIVDAAMDACDYLTGMDLSAVIVDG
jgi:hypothetical protein